MAPLSHPSPAPSYCSLVDPRVTTIPIILPHLHVLFLQSRGSPQPQTRAHWPPLVPGEWAILGLRCFGEWGAGGAAGSRSLATVGTGLSMALCRTHAGSSPRHRGNLLGPGDFPRDNTSSLPSGQHFGRLPPPTLGSCPFGPQSWLLSLGWVAVPPRVWQGQSGSFSCPVLPPVPTACDLGAAHCTTSHSLLPCGGAGGGWDVGMLRGLVTARPLLQESSVLLSVAAGWSAYGCGVPDLGAAPHNPKDIPWCHQDKDRSKTCSVLGSKQMARAQPRHGCSIPMDCTGLGIPNRALIPDLLPPQLSIPFLPAAAGNPGDAPSSTQHLTPNSHPWEATSVPCPGDTEVVSISFNGAVAWGRRI